MTRNLRPRITLMSIAEDKTGAEGAGEVRHQRQRWSEAQKRQIVAETIGTKVVPPDLRMRRRRSTDDAHGRLLPLLPPVGVV